MTEIIKYFGEYLLHGDERYLIKGMNLFDDLELGAYSPLELIELQDIFGTLDGVLDFDIVEECVGRLAKFS